MGRRRVAGGGGTEHFVDELDTQRSTNPHGCDHSCNVLRDRMVHVPAERIICPRRSVVMIVESTLIVHTCFDLKSANSRPLVSILVDAAPTLASLILAHGVSYISSTEGHANHDASSRIRVVILTSIALSSIISGAFVSAAAMTNFPQAVFFGTLLFFALDVGTWWTLRRATSQNKDVTSLESRSSFALSVTVIAFSAYRFPRSIAWAFASFLASHLLVVLFGRTLSISKANVLPIIASMAILEVTTRQGLSVFIDFIASTLGQAESEGDVVRLLFQESVMFGNRFVAQWQGIVTALQLVASVILHLHIQDRL